METVRQLKFRAWSIENKMFYFNFWDIESDGMNQIVSPHILHSDIPIMQFIGHKDIKGKEIYDGDIVKADAVDPFGNQIIGKILFHNGAFWIGTKDNLVYNVVCYFEGIMEVIGNIYQNPELLK